MTKEFPDISGWNTPIDWKVGLPLVDGVINKALEYWQDVTFKPNWMILLANPDKIKGAYYFWQSTHDPISKARQFIDIVQPKQGDLLAIDMEEESAYCKTLRGKPELAALPKRWLDEVQRLTGIKPWIYTSVGWWNRYACAYQLGKTAAPYWTNDYYLWLGQYHDPKYAPSLPIGWTIDKLLLWQWCSTGQIPGFVSPNNPNVDQNKVMVSLATLRTKLGGPVVIPPVIPPIIPPVIPPVIPPIIPGVGYKVVITAWALNVRTGPSSTASTFFPPIYLQGVVPLVHPVADVVTIIEKVNGWGAYEVKPGVRGWINLAWTWKL